jgi:hypothetical protein
VNQDEWCARALFLVVQANAINLGEVAVLGVGNARANFVEGNIRRPRKPKNPERQRRHYNQRQHNFQ